MFPVLDKIKKANNYEFLNGSIHSLGFLKRPKLNDQSLLGWDSRRKLETFNSGTSSFVPNRIINWRALAKYPESFWFAAVNQIKSRRKKYYFTKCSNRALVTAG